MRRRHLGVLIITLLLVAGGILGYSLFKNGIFPVARVNGTIIFFNEVRENLEISKKLYTQSSDLEELGEGSKELKKLFEGGEAELFERVFEGLIENTIIRTSVSSSLLVLAKERTQESLAGRDTSALNASLKLAYGWGLEEFSRRIFEPQALEEVLIEEKGDEFEAWLADARSTAKVNIWFLPLTWQDGQLVDK